VVTIGTFDGVHRGHRALLARAHELAAANPPAQVVALAFDPHPMTVLSPDAAPARLTTFEQRCRLLLEAGADRVERLKPTPQLLGLSAETFIRRLVAKHHSMAFVEGPDFRFGRARQGDVDALKRLGEELGFACEVVPRITAVLSDHNLVPATSTMLRWLIAQGRVRDAAAILDRPYALTGRVVRGDRRGRAIGFSTANLSTQCLLPADGVYAGMVALPDGRRFAAGVHVGGRETFGDPRRTIEAHILGAPVVTIKGTQLITGLPEYGWTMELSLIVWLRDQMRFESVNQLVAQMRRDCERAAGIVAVENQRALVQGAAA
jgi:riboflavin kinase/FMN adenylyltransferase